MVRFSTALNSIASRQVKEMPVDSTTLDVAIEFLAKLSGGLKRGEKMVRKLLNLARRAHQRSGRAFVMLNVGATLCGFHVDSVTDIPDVGGRMWRMTYEKNGAELVWLERDDEVKTFVIAFKTLPEDDTGVAHILEHSVLSGSEKYPVKSPFGEMRKSSVRVFMNAMTSRDATYYPFSTRNDVDYLNLADVYLDAVFHPLTLKDPSAFRQEGWHYEWDKAKRELSVNGVVFNEMKGVFALPERRAYRELTSALYPDIVYGHDSGGRPEKIPDLTYEKYCAFHKRFYHPSNARIFIDGKVHIKDVLAKLDSYLSGFDRLDVKADIPSQKPVEVRLRIPYESAKCENKAILVEGWSVGLAADPVYCHALDILTDYLCGSNEAPLKKALLEKKLCRDVSMDRIDYREMPLYIILKDTSEEKLDECRKTIRDILADVCKKGFDKKRLNALINRDEFSERELNTTRPKGLIFFSRALRRWLYGGDPAAALSLSNIYTKLRADVDNGKFETILRERILANRHHAEVVMSPDAGLEKRRIAENKARMDAVRDAMKDADLDRLAEDVAKLKEYQQRKDSPEDIAKIPRLRSSELSQAGIPVSGEVQKENDVVRIKTKTTADGVFYLSMYFPMDDFAEDELLKMPLFAKLLGKLRTSRHSALDLQTEIAGNVGRISYSTASTARGRYFKVSVASLIERKDAAIGLLKEVLLDTCFEDKPEIEAVLRQKQLAAERDVSRDGRNLALCYAKRGIGERWMASDLLHGERQLRWLQGATADERLMNWYANVPSRLFRKNGMVVSYTDNLADETVNGLLSSFGDRVAEKREIPIAANNLNGFSIDGDTGFAAWVARLPDGVAANGAMRVAAKILSLEYLHNEVREIGGAYGAMMRVTPEGLVECFSYRDPNPGRSLQKMNGLGGALRRFVETGADIDRYIVATIASMEPYRSPADEASRAVELFVENRDGEDVERVRREVLATTKDQLLEFADLLDKITAARTTCVVGGDRQVADMGEGQIQPIMKVKEIACESL